MNKNILIISGVVIVAAVGAYFALDVLKPPSLDSEQSILADYKKLLEKVENPQTKTDLSGACGNSQKFAQKVQALEDELSALKERKIDNLMQGSQSKHPGVCARDYNGKVMLPGSWQLDFDGNQIPPGSWPLDFDGKPIPPPGWPLDFDSNPLPPGSSEIPSGYMPPDMPIHGSQLPDLIGNVSATPLQEIMGLEKRIRLTLDDLKLLCDEKPKPEETSNKCKSACNNYVKSCLTLVPNASKSLFDDGYKSCLKECAKWSAEKTECMITAPNCEAFTDKCGL